VFVVNVPATVLVKFTFHWKNSC